MICIIKINVILTVIKLAFFTVLKFLNIITYPSEKKTLSEACRILSNVHIFPCTISSLETMP
jgi:hypothetical protein